jgi:hypothetical protein
MGYTVETFEQNGYTVQIMADDDAPNPRKEFDQLATFVCFHRRYDLGDDHEYSTDDFSGWQELYNWIVKDHKPAAIIPVGLIDHSGISMYAGSTNHWCDPGGWDSGQVGFAFMSKEAALKEYGGKRLTKKVRDLAEKCIRTEMEEYDSYLRGDVWGYTIETPDGDHVDSCWGFFGLNYCIEEAKRSVPDKPVIAHDKEAEGEEISA